MPRQDLMALSEDDLALLTNRGTVKRCARELDEKEFTCTFNEDTLGNLTVLWSDGIECSLPGHETLVSSRCSCPAVGICRHLVRTVLAYRLQQAGLEDVSAQVNLPDIQTTGGWNPGDIADDLLAVQVKSAVIKRAKKLFEAGQVVELIIGAKPIARFFTIPAAVRFLVPGDCRYTYCNCVEESPCVHVPLSVFCFRLLKQRSAGIVSTSQNNAAPPLAVLAELESLLQETIAIGIAGCSSSFVARFQKVRQKCESGGLLWISELIVDLLDERERYHAADALFSPERLVEIIGELCARHDALVRETGAVPRVFVTGSCGDRPVGQASLRLIGLGCGVETRKASAVITAYFQDDDSGHLVGVRREFAAPDANGDDRRPFSQLAGSAALKSNTLSSLASGQLLCKGGKLTASRLYTTGRSTPLSLNPQSFNWERLRFPVLVEGFSELRSLLAFQPPFYLGPKYPGRNLFVCAINRIEGLRFSSAHQSLVGTAVDSGGARATVYHPYTFRGKEGLELTLRTMSDTKICPRFIAGMFSTTATGTVVRPISIVIEENGSRRILQPWVDAWAPVDRTGAGSTKKEALAAGETLALREPVASQELLASPGQLVHPLPSFALALEDSLAQLLINGVERSGEQTIRHWRQFFQECESLGLDDLAKAAHRLYLHLENRLHEANWSSAVASSGVLDLCVIHLAVREIILDALTPMNS